MARRTPRGTTDNRETILRAAEQLFAEKGFPSTQIAEIAAAAGIGIGSFYRQFPDKGSVLLAILATLFGDIRAKLLALRAGMVERTFLEQLMMIQRTFEIVFEVFATHPAVGLTLLRSGYGISPESEQLVWNAFSELAGDVAADVVRATEMGVLAIDTPRNVGDAIIGMVLQLSHRLLVDGDISALEAARFCTRFTIGGLLAFAPGAISEQVRPLLQGIAPRAAE
ncbi:MAG: TetR/AcrR family transcriptional regulator [Myxococcales bacterium]|nr:TetR/AcrR family transcriptional regulator [Myxococcales bacterium]